jgi:hypothetical protein
MDFSVFIGYPFLFPSNRKHRRQDNQRRRDDAEPSETLGGGEGKQSRARKHLDYPLFGRFEIPESI